MLEFTVPDRNKVTDAAEAIARIGEGEPHVDKETGVINGGVGARGSEALVEAVRSLDSAGVQTQGLALRRPSLDDVFLALTGHAAEEDGEPGGGKRSKRRGRRQRRRKGGVVMTAVAPTAGAKSQSRRAARACLPGHTGR